MPETAAGLGWEEQPDELTMIVKLPISAGMVRDLYVARESGAGSSNTIG
jgi:hypothetical protein